MRKRMFVKKILALVLVATVFMTDIPAFAFDYEKMKEYGMEPITATHTAEDFTDPNCEEAYVVSEVTEKRESNIKHFRMSNGNITAAVYPFDVHYEDEEGKMQNIDNSLVSENDGTDEVISNRKNSAYVKFMKKSNSNKLYTIDKNGHKIKVSIDGVSKVRAVVTDFEESKKEDHYKLQNISGQVTYYNILENTDIQYTYVSTELKENIILKDEVDFESITYTYRVNGGIEAIQNDDKSITIYEKDSEEVVFVVDAPVMWDAAGNYYDDLEIELLQNKNSKITVKLSWKLPKGVKYPVTVDPVLELNVPRTNIQDTHIIASNPSQNYDYNNHIRVRQDGDMMVQYPLPTLKSSDKIINAQMILTPYYWFDQQTVYNNVNNYSTPIYITAHKIKKSWNETTATYNSIAPENGFYDDTIISYREMNGSSDYYVWDITKLASEWAEGYSTNYGVLFKFDEVPSGATVNAYFCSTNGAYIPSEAYPNVIYQYINTAGLEEYYSYHTHDVGYAGTVHINDMTGNMTLVNPLVQTGGDLMPISVSLVYNTDSYLAETYGRCWNLNWSQRIDKSDSYTYNGVEHVKYRDGDGTEHYFAYNSEKGCYVDEIDPDRTLTLNSSGSEFKMTDSSDTSMYFTRNGTIDEWFLTKVEDAYGNYINVVLDQTYMYRVNQVYSSTGNVVDFVYRAYGFLSQIKYKDNDEQKTITVDYNNYVDVGNNCVGKITYADGTYVQYHYYSGTYNISKIVDIDGYNMAYGYTSGVPQRVNSITEYGSDNSLGQKMTMTYQPTATHITDVTNGRKYLYTFEVTGTLKSVVDVTANDGNGYGQYYEYNNGNTTETKGKGNLTFISETQKSTVNVVRDHSFENDLDLWAYQAWKQTTGTSSGEVSSSIKYLGTKSYRLYRSTDCNATRVLGYERVSLTAGEKYTLSAYVNTSQMVSQGGGASVYVAGEYFYFESEQIAEISNEWQRISVSFIAPKTIAASICFSMQAASGYAYFDCVQFEEGDLSDYNLLENAGFEGPFGTTAEGWGCWTEENYYDSSVYAGGRYSVRFPGGPNKDHEYQQVIYVTGSAGDTYVASAFAKADSVDSEGWQFTMRVMFMQWGTYVGQALIPFNSYTSDWQKVSGAATAEGYYTAIVLSLLYCENANEVYFDNVQLLKDTFGNSYTYDDNGNVISTVDLQGKEEYTFKYDGNNQLIQQTNITGSKIDYTYNPDIPTQLTKVTSDGVSVAYDYDGKGNAISTKTAESGYIDSASTAANPAMTSSATYSESGEYMTSLTDSRGNTSTYSYNETRGYLTSETNAKNVATNYIYNSSELFTGVSTANGDTTSTVGYTYDANKQLTSILSPSGTPYNFTYDSFGRSKTIKIGNGLLSEYAYNSKGLVDNVTYGNGTELSYSYDGLNRKIETYVNDTLRYKYNYDGSSRLLEVTDLSSNKAIKHGYDIIGRPVSERLVNSANLLILAELDIRYDDSKNRISGYTVDVNEESKQIDYVYGTGTVSPDLVTSVKVDGTEKLSYTYDGLNRLATRTIGTATPYTTEYTFLEGATEDKTTTLVKSVKNGNDTLTYTYDVLGNITSVSKNGTLVESYTYDNLNQLVSVTRGADTYTYTYDAGGNILSVSKNGTTEDTYTYGNTEWKDLLTSYNGQTITYDAIGNPLTYRDGMAFTWTDDRELSTITKGTDSISYTYGADGLRTSKTVNGTTTDYYWLNGILYGQKTGSEYILFLYDENGSAYGFIIKNGTSEATYYYELNVQGDVIGIIDSAGTRVVEYAYDAWGNILSITGTLADTIGQQNPIRYRGYYYDAETGFYYVSSRYYDPEVGRWINSDNMVLIGDDILGTNLFAYCGNNPINRVDPSGNAWLSAIIKTVAKIAVVALTIAKIVCTVKEVKRVKNEFDTLPEPTKDITDSFRDTLRQNADTVKETTKSKGIIESSKQFYNNVRNNGEWDLKQYPEYQGTFQFNDLVIQGQDIGNINFGYTGKALGLPDSVLLAGAGVAQIMAGTSNFSFIMASNGDDLRDQMYIMYGIMLYKEDN